MKTLTRTICLTLTLLLGSVGTSWGADNEISEKVIKYFESEKESLVIKAFWTSQDTLNLTAINNNNISTYSILACAKLRDIGFSTKDIQLRIIDHRRYESDGSINVLNEFFCKKKGPKVLHYSPTQTPPSENIIIQPKATKQVKKVADIDFEDIRYTMLNTTEAKFKALARDLEGQHVRWTGWVKEVNEKMFGGYELWIDMDDPDEVISVQDVTFPISEKLAMEFDLEDEVTFEGDISSVMYILGSCQVYLKNVEVISY